MPTQCRSRSSLCARRRATTPVIALAAGWLAVAGAGCRQEAPPAAAPKINYSQELPPGTLALRKLPPERYPDFSSMGTDLAALRMSAGYSQEYLKHPSSRNFFPYLDITHERTVATVQEIERLAAAAAARPVRWNDEIRNRFDVYQSIGAATPDGTPGDAGGGYTGAVLFTGYFTPIYNASPTRGGPYQWPLYKKPIDLVSDETGEGVYRRAVTPGSPAAADPTVGSPDLAPLADRRYWTRAEIERGGKLAGQELVWLTSRWEAYVVTVQGSARLRLPDGRIDEIGFAGTNGHAYPPAGQAPGDRMVADGVLPKDQRTLQGMGRYFAEHPEAMDRYLLLNPRTTFFAERPGGPFGKLNVPVTAFATIATDKQVYPRAMPAYVVTPEGGGKVMLDQDAGGAIRSAGRADIYMGVGEAAEQMAGRQMSVGRLYYLALKPEFVK